MPSGGQEYQKTKRIAPISTLIGWIIGVILFIFLALIFSIIVEWVGLFTLWKDEGINHSYSMYRAELEYVDRNLRSFPLFDDARTTVASAITKIDSWWESYSNGFAFSNVNESRIVTENRFLGGLEIPANLGTSAFYVTKTFTLRLFIILFTLPLFILALVMAISDGLVERELRKYGGDKESNVIFDYTSKLSTWVVGTGCVIYLSMPVSIDPLFCILPTFALFFSLTRTAITKYKKRL